MTAAQEAFEDIFLTARDGLRLHGRLYRSSDPNASARRPLLCLPGLTRNGRDFHTLALALAGRSGQGRDVYTFDYRGRGFSENDSNWRNYAVPIEMQDVLEFITRSEIFGASIIGTSRGGLIAMVMAAAQPSAVGPVILNDIGPVVEPAGLARISAYVGRIPLPGTWTEATKLVRDMNVRAFPAVPDEDWEVIARQWFNERKGRPAPGYDAKLANAMSVLDGPIPALWSQFEALRNVPVMVLRGEHSDILSPTTVEEMRRRHPHITAVMVKGQGHAPMLRDKPTIEAIAKFLVATDPVSAARAPAQATA